MAHEDNEVQKPKHVRSGSAGDATYTLPKKLIVCCDGTWMDSDNGWVSGGLFSKGQGHAQVPTNVTRITRAISSEDDGHHPQVVYYQAGIGTGNSLSDRVLGGGTGRGLAVNIREAYAFLADNYRVNDPDGLVPPDAIFLIGFSRGAFTARSIAGLLGAIGLLKKHAMQHFYEAFSDWENAGNPDYEPMFFDHYFAIHTELTKVKPPDSLAKDRKRINEYMDEYLKILLSLGLSQKVHIKIVGVWDTVGALGIPVNPILQTIFPFLPSFVHEYSWFDTSLDAHIKNAFQALALDEHRFPFSPTLWENPHDCPTNLKQCWFPGAHSNVGGSYSDTGTADITLAWMMDQLAGNTTPHPKGFVHHDWIKFDEEYIDTWYANELRYYQSTRETAYRGWGMGHVYESNTFPQSLAGSRVRSPGLYHRIFYESGKPDPAHLLVNTNEHVHACVRARIDLGGRAVEPAPWYTRLIRWLTGGAIPTYKPELPKSPLAGWQLDDGHANHQGPPNGSIGMDATQQGRVVWRWTGPEADCNLPKREMPEDRLGPFERKLLAKDPQLAQAILFSNNGWREVDETADPQKANPDRTHTFPV